MQESLSTMSKKKYLPLSLLTTLGNVTPVVVLTAPNAFMKLMVKQ